MLLQFVLGQYRLRSWPISLVKVIINSISCPKENWALSRKINSEAIFKSVAFFIVINLGGITNIEGKTVSNKHFVGKELHFRQEAKKLV